MNTGKRQNRIGGSANKSRVVTKTRLPDKQMPIEGVYKNVALTHSMTSLVGSVVLVQVKNGKVYEGILKTFSPKMEIVLSAAHLVEDVGAKGDSVPTQDTLIEHIIFPVDHVVYMSALSVDLTYGEQRDGFTDGAISRYNGHGTEKDLKELQPWQGDAEVEDIRLDDSSGSGWTAEEMFKRNEQSFNVKSVYSDDLEQYTTPLQKGDSAEWQEREKKAEKIAAEIESSDQSQRRYEAENEDCVDEEEKFSAVVRPGRHAPAPTIQFGTAPVGLNSTSGRYVAPHYRDRGINQNHARQYRLPDPADSVKANGKLDDKKIPAGPAEPRQSKAASSEPITFSPPAGKPDSKVNVSPSTEKEEARKLKEFGEKFKLAETSKQPAKPAVPVDEADVKPSAAPNTASAPQSAAAAPPASCVSAPLPGNVLSSSAGTPSAAASGPPGTSTAPSAGASVSEPVEAGQQREAADCAEKQEKDGPKVVSSLNPNAPAFQPRQQVPPSPQPPAGYNILATTPTHNPPRNNKKATVSIRGGGPHHQHHQAQMTDQFTPAHVQAATGSPFITNQYAAGYMNYQAYGPTFSMLPMQAPLTPRSSQEMGQGQHFAYGMPQGVMQPHMPYGGQGAQQILQPGGMHVQPLPQPTPPPQLSQGGGGGGVPSSVGGPVNPQQVMQHGNGGVAAAAASSQQQQSAPPPAALAAQGVLPQQQYGGYQGQPTAASAAALGHPPLQPSPQSSAASPLAAAPVAYAGAQYYQYQPIAYGSMTAQPPHGSMHHQAVQQPVMFYQVPGQQHQHHQPLFHAPMQGISMMGAAPPAGQGGSPMYMQQQIAAVPVHHQMQNYQQQQQQQP